MKTSTLFLSGTGLSLLGLTSCSQTPPPTTFVQQPPMVRDNDLANGKRDVEVGIPLVPNGQGSFYLPESSFGQTVTGYDVGETTALINGINDTVDLILTSDGRVIPTKKIGDYGNQGFGVMLAGTRYYYPQVSRSVYISNRSSYIAPRNFDYRNVRNVPVSSYGFKTNPVPIVAKGSTFVPIVKAGSPFVPPKTPMVSAGSISPVAPKIPSNSGSNSIPNVKAGSTSPIASPVKPTGNTYSPPATTPQVKASTTSVAPQKSTYVTPPTVSAGSRSTSISTPSKR